MFEKFKYGLKPLEKLCDNFYDTVSDENKKEILNKIILEKFYKQYPNFNGMIENNYVSFLNIYKELKSDNNRVKEIPNIFSIVENIEKNKIIIFLDKNKNEEFLKENGQTLMYNLQNKNIHIESFYKSMYDYIFDSNRSNEFKLDRWQNIMLNSDKNILKNITNDKLFNTIDNFVNEIIDKKNISSYDIKMLKNINNKMLSNEIEKNITNLYNNIDFQKINSNEYPSLLQRKDSVSKELFDNILNHYNITKNNTKFLMEVIEKSKYKENYIDTLKKINSEQDRINKENRDNINNALLGALLASAVVASNTQNNESLFDTALNIGAGVVIGNVVDDFISNSSDSTNSFGGF